MDVVSQKLSKLSKQKIVLQKSFQEYSDKHGFSYEEWINPPAGHFYEDYKKQLAEIDSQMAPPLSYQS